MSTEPIWSNEWEEKAIYWPQWRHSKGGYTQPLIELRWAFGSEKLTLAARDLGSLLIKIKIFQKCRLVDKSSIHQKSFHCELSASTWFPVMFQAPVTLNNQTQPDLGTIWLWKF